MSDPVSDPVSDPAFVPDGTGGGTSQGWLNYADGTEPFSKYYTAAQVQAQLARIKVAQVPSTWAQASDTPPGAGTTPDLRDIARLVGWDCWVDRLAAHTPATPPAPIAAPNVASPS